MFNILHQSTQLVLPAKVCCCLHASAAADNDFVSSVDYFLLLLDTVGLMLTLLAFTFADDEHVHSV